MAKGVPHLAGGVPHFPRGVPHLPRGVPHLPGGVPHLPGGISFETVWNCLFLPYLTAFRDCIGGSGRGVDGGEGERRVWVGPFLGAIGWEPIMRLNFKGILTRMSFASQYRSSLVESMTCSSIA